MEKMDYWRLCDEMSVLHAALLVIGEDPGSFPYVMSWQMHEWPDNLAPTLAALSNAILGGRLRATIRRKAWERGWDESPGDGEVLTKNVKLFPAEDDFSGDFAGVVRCGIIYRVAPDWELTTVLVEDLKTWLRGRGFNSGFFFPQADDGPDFLDRNHVNYAPKLAAAIRAWQAVTTDPTLSFGMTVKKALLKWLRKNADRFGLTKEDGSPNEQGIEEIAKIANWDSKGGAPKTPG